MSSLFRPPTLTNFRDSVSLGDLPQIEDFISQYGPDIAKHIDEQGNSVFHLLARRNDGLTLAIFNYFKALIGPLQLEMTDLKGNTPLHIACCYDQKSLVEAFIQAGAPLDAQNHVGKTPMHRACNNYYPDNVQMLLKAGANPHIRNGDGKTALEIATADEFYPIVSLLTPISLALYEKEALDALSSQVMSKASDEHLTTLETLPKTANLRL